MSFIFVSLQAVIEFEYHSSLCYFSICSHRPLFIPLSKYQHINQHRSFPLNAGFYAKRERTLSGILQIRVQLIQPTHSHAADAHARSFVVGIGSRQVARRFPTDAPNCIYHPYRHSWFCFRCARAHLCRPHLCAPRSDLQSTQPPPISRNRNKNCANRPAGIVSRLVLYVSHEARAVRKHLRWWWVRVCVCVYVHVYTSLSVRTDLLSFHLCVRAYACECTPVYAKLPLQQQNCTDPATTTTALSDPSTHTHTTSPFFIAIIIDIATIIGAHTHHTHT